MQKSPTELALSGVSHNMAALTLVLQFTALGATNTTNCLALGEIAHAQVALGISDAELTAALKPGEQLPSKSRRTVYRTAYATWVLTLGRTPEGISHISIDKLYHAARLIGRTDEHGVTIDPAEALRRAESSSDSQLRAWAAKGGIEGTRGTTPKESSGISTVKMQSDAAEALQSFAERLARVSSAKHPISISAALLFGLEQLDSLPDTSLSYLWREAHGEVTEEEAAAVQTVTLDVVEVEGGDDE